MENKSQPSETNLSNVCQAAALGDLLAVKDACETDRAYVSLPDEQGHPPLHWAALNNHQHVLQYLLSNGADIHALNREGATALHWAVVRNALTCIEGLLRAGADKHARDGKGYQPCHVAAQYGHTAALYHLVLRWNCDFNALDNDQRSPLHWASYKGYHDLVRLLLVLGCDPHAQDSEGCNALHWAAVRGCSEAATILLQASGHSILSVTDNMGNTPAQCAKNGNHHMLCHYLTTEGRKLAMRAAPQNYIVGALMKMHFAPIIWIACLVTITVFFLKVVGRTPGDPAPPRWMIICSAVILVSFSFGLVLMAVVNVSDPGYIPKRGERSRQRGKGYSALPDTDNLDCPALWAGNWEQLCVTCKIVRPLRAKHDPVSNRCIEVFDHFCPWVGNVIGKHNRHLFIMFIGCMLVALLGAYCVGLGRLSQTGFFLWGPRHRSHFTPAMTWSLIWMICNIPLLFTVVGLAVAQTVQVVQNMTTNEMSNWPRYKHFRVNKDASSGGVFHNPFDKGMRRNLHELCWPAEYPVLPAFVETPEMEKMRKQLDGLPSSR